MGLDMYLEKIPCINGITAQSAHAYGEWLEYIEYIRTPLEDGEKEKYTFEEWVGHALAKSLPEVEVREKLAPYVSIKYDAWDEDKEYPHIGVIDEVGYWRKANAIHKWFVDNVQNGVDDCEYHNEVTKEQIEKLVKICEVSLICKTPYLLPTQSGFFFGGTEYDEYYWKSLEETITMLTKVLEETDFDKYAIYYCSSW